MCGRCWKPAGATEPTLADAWRVEKEEKKEAALSTQRLVLYAALFLFVSVLAVGFLSLLPVYAVHQGMPPAGVGYFMAFAYAVLVGGSIAVGWLFERFGRPRFLFLAVGVGSMAGLLLMRLTAGIWLLAALTALICFCIGMGMPLVGILVGHYVEQGARGRVFGILSSVNGLGALVAGLTAGKIADRWGYPAMFAALAVPMALWTLTALAAPVTRQPAAAAPGSPAPEPAAGGLGAAFYLLLAGYVVACLASFVRSLGSPLAMLGLGYSAAAVSNTQAALGAVSMPLPFLVGWLSDRLGRKGLLMICFLMATAALLTLARATALWQFFVAAGLIALFNLSGSLGAALTADLLPRPALPRALARLHAAQWFAGVVGFALTGLAFQRFGTLATFLGAACLPLVGVALVAAIGRPAAKPSEA